MGEKSQRANEFANLLKELLLKEDVKIKLMDSVEAELASSYIGILNNLITSIVNSNVTRKSILQK